MHNINHKQSGFNLIELMIAIAIGSFLVLGAAYAFQEAKNTYVTNENLARLHEQSQYALDLLEEDIRLANYWGLHSKRIAVSNSSEDTSYTLGAITDDCPNNWALNLTLGITGSNENYPGWADTDCLPTGNYKAKTDTLVLRHADNVITPDTGLVTGTVYARSDETPASSLFIANGTNSIPSGFAPTAQNHALIVHGYYVQPYTFDTSDSIPSLRRLKLDGAAGSPRIINEVVTNGVEDFQVQFGIDLDPPGEPDYNTINTYVNADHPVLDPTNASFNPRARVLSVRIWLLMRNDRAEPNYTNKKSYSYAAVTNYQPDDGFRRLLVSKTIQIRNISID